MAEQGKSWPVFVALVLACITDARASDACATTAIIAAADVSVSDGTSFRVESLFHTHDHSSIRHIRDDGDQVIAVEGPLAWYRVGDEERPGADFHQVFALGHQYHAFLLHFAEIVGGVVEQSEIEFQDETRPAWSGNYPFGGKVHLVERSKKPEGLVFDFGETGYIEVALSDWRTVGETRVPFNASVDDGQRVFEYRYTDVTIEERSPTWFYDELPAPGIDEVQVHRLHRMLLAAHCLGDADMIADLSAPVVTSANSGSLQQTAIDELRERFTTLFENLDYSSYVDVARPVVEVSAEGDLGWVAVNVRAAGTQKSSGKAFDDLWAWIMTVRKIDGVWLHAGNASSRARQPGD
jgi:ketosteroid isomerase-like protein